MKFFKDLLESVASGFVSAVSEGAAAGSAVRVVEGFCRQLSWSVDERVSANSVTLHFKDPLIGIRKVLVTVGDEGALMSFRVHSAVFIPPRQVPAAALGYLLERNCEPFVGWQMYIDDDGDAAFAINYWVLVAGLHPGMFKIICETMVNESHEFDARMDKAGLLR